MKKITKGLALIVSFAIISSFSQNLIACGLKGCCCKPCPMCSVFADGALIDKSKAELLKMKELIQQHLSKENVKEMSKEAVQSMQNVLEKIEKKLGNKKID